MGGIFKNMMRKKRHAKGYILMLALVVTASLTLLLAAYSLSIVYKNNIASQIIKSIKAKYLADAGIELARSLDELDMYYSSPIYPTGEGSFVIDEDANVITFKREVISDILMITSTVEYEGAEYTRKAEADYNNSLINIKAKYNFYSSSDYDSMKATIIKWD